ncbi:MAG: hypothetical protein OEY97_03135 [Nitrospirota bacterium]|nr:hypothetical protein [Nitrospirota bacterium]
MTFVNVVIMLAILLVAMVASMVYYGSRGKKKMGELFHTAAERLNGTVTQPSRMHYPHMSATVDGRPVEVFYHLSEGHRKTSDIVYLLLATPTRLPAATLVMQEGFFAKTPDKGSFNDAAGDYLPDLMPGRYVYSTDEAHTRALFATGGVSPFLTALHRYPQVVMGPDAVTVGRPYGGPKDLDPERLEGEIRRMISLAIHLEEFSAKTASTTAPGTPVTATAGA